MPDVKSYVIETNDAFKTLLTEENWKKDFSFKAKQECVRLWHSGFQLNANVSMQVQSDHANMLTLSR